MLQYIFKITEMLQSISTFPTSPFSETKFRGEEVFRTELSLINSKVKP